MQDVQSLINSHDVEGIAAFMEEHDLELVGSSLVPKDQAAKKRLEQVAELANQRQQARKILLNSLK